MTRLLERLVPIDARHWLNARTLVAFGLVALFIHAVLVDVVIHPFFFTVHSLVPMLIPGGLLGAYVFFRMTKKAPSLDANATGVLALLILPFLAAPYCWLVLAKTPAWVAAMAFGTPHSEVREFEIRRPGGKGCAYRAEVIDDLRLYPAYLCVSGAFASDYDRQRVQLRLTGERTPLGFRITHFEHVSNDQGPLR